MSTDGIIFKDLVSTLEDRKATHGHYPDHAAITQEIKQVMKSTYNWTRQLNHCEKEALEMIAHKIGRILAGDPHFPDHWHDIAGYARLVEESLTSPTDSSQF